jgi:phosphate:Na+ symporter
MYILADIIPIADIEWTETIFYLVGGLGIFLFGIKTMGDSLKALAGKKIKIIIEKTTTNPFFGVLIGILVTGLIQSSSGTTALTVGLVRAGLMTLPQAIGIILGANIGTTITSVLIGLKIKDYALPIIAIGSFLIFFFQGKKYKNLGGVFLGFGMLFYGLDVMGGKLKLLANTFEFIEIIENVADKPYLGLIVGAVSTAAIQSSSATIGILQTIYQESEGAFPLISAIAILFGNNIGTTVTAVLAAIGGSVAAKRTALAHVLFNVFGSVLFFIFIRPYTTLIANLAIWTGLEAYDSLVISYAHMGFNIINTFIMFWFIKQLVWIVTFIIRGDDGLIEVNVDSLQEHLILESPILALESAKIVVKNMGQVAQEMFNTTIQYSFNQEHKLLENGMQYEEMLDTIDKKAHDYLVKISQAGLIGEASQLQAEYVDTIRDFERMGDHCTNILQFFEMRHEEKVELSEEATTELRKLYDVVQQTLAVTLEAFDTNDKTTAQRVVEYENVIDRLVIKNRKRHIRRINNNESTETQDALYVDILSNIERIGDHCNNIAINIIQDSYYNEEMDYEVALDD